MFAVLLAPYILQRRVASRRSVCELRQIELVMAITRFEATHGQFPGYRSALFAAGRGPIPVTEQEVSPPIGWVYATLPYLELPRAQADAESTTFQQIFDQYGPSGPAELRGRLPEMMLAALLCPDDPRHDGPRSRSWSSFVANSGMPDAPPTDMGPLDWPANGLLLDAFTPPQFPVEPLSLEQLNQGDGAEQTLLVSENLDCGLWTDHEEAQVSFLWVPHLVDGQPDPGDELLRINHQAGQGDGSRRFARPSSKHPAGVNAVFASGRTQFLNQEIDYLVYARLMTSDTFGVTLPGTQQPVDPPYRTASPVEQSENGEGASPEPPDEAPTGRLTDDEIQSPAE
jgi:hypothetical protein